jgi:uncharacterized protein YacL
MILYILRGVFILLAAAVTALYLVPNQIGASVQFGQFVLILSIAMGLAGIVIAVDVFNKHKKLSSLSGVFIGLIAGLVVAYALGKMVDLIPLFIPTPKSIDAVTFRNLLEGVKVFIGLITCYVGMSLVIQTKDDFRFIIPYVEFAKQVRGNRPILLDTSVIIDGRIVDLLDTKIFQGGLIVPKFVLAELQTIADSADKLKRARGRRGLDMLQKLQDSPEAQITIDESDAEGANVDQKLVSAAQVQQARLMTNDFNLNKLATLRGVDVINLNDLAKALRPVVLPGEAMRVKIVKAGESPNQGVGYLDDGTMVVVESARAMMGQEVDLVVTSTLQTSAGRMIFGRSHGEEGETTQHEEPPPQRPVRAGPSGRNPRRV